MDIDLGDLSGLRNALRLGATRSPAPIIPALASSTAFFISILHGSFSNIKACDRTCQIRIDSHQLCLASDNLRRRRTSPPGSQRNSAISELRRFGDRKSDTSDLPASRLKGCASIDRDVRVATRRPVAGDHASRDRTGPGATRHPDATLRNDQPCADTEIRDST